MVKINLGFLKPRLRSTPPGLCLLTDAARSEAMLKEWQQELLTGLMATAPKPTPASSRPSGERA